VKKITIPYVHLRCETTGFRRPGRLLELERSKTSINALLSRASLEGRIMASSANPMASSAGIMAFEGSKARGRSWGTIRGIFEAEGSAAPDAGGHSGSGRLGGGGTAAGLR